MKTRKKTTLLRNNGGKERQEDDPTHVSALCLSFPPSFQSRVVFLRVFIFALFLYFFRSIPTCNKHSFRNFFQKLFPLVTCIFCVFIAMLRGAFRGAGPHPPLDFWNVDIVQYMLTPLPPYILHLCPPSHIFCMQP